MAIVRILLVGDAQCGKTSIILALVGEEFPPFVPPRAEEITIPGDVTPEKVPTHIVDFCEQEQDEEALHNEICRAHVVCVVYDLTAEDALDRVTGYWLPLIRQCCPGPQPKPVILAGNKSDIAHDNEAHSIRMQDIFNAYLEVETGVECSAKELQNVSELFYFAQKAVLHPTAPLYSFGEGELKPACVTALERVFKICDADNDGILNDQELNEFQIRCFDAPLQPQALQDVKVIVARNTTLGVCNDGLTLEGFLFLNKLFVLRGRHETTWKVVRKFGYSNSLELKDEYLHPIFSPQPGSSVELSSSGYQFLTDLFKKYDKDGDQALSPQEQEDLFSLCPQFMWDEQVLSLTVETNGEGWITLDGFLAFWSLQTSMDYVHTATFLAWMGFPIVQKASLASALKEVAPHDRQRKVYWCRVMGGRGCGKSTFVRGLIGKAKSQSEDDEAMTVKCMTVGSSHIYVVLHECSYDPGEQQYTSVLSGTSPVAVLLEKYDVACLLYDSSQTTSFATASQIFTAIDNSVSDLVPCVFIATKCDLPVVKQTGELQPDQYCKELGLPLPLHVSQDHPDVLAQSFSRLAQVSLDPSSNIPSSFHIPRWIKTAGMGLLVAAGLGSLLFILIRLGRRRIVLARPSSW